MPLARKTAKKKKKEISWTMEGRFAINEKRE